MGERPSLLPKKGLRGFRTNHGRDIEWCQNPECECCRSTLSANNTIWVVNYMPHGRASNLMREMDFPCRGRHTGWLLHPKILFLRVTPNMVCWEDSGRVEDK